jgi:hypothetical protein
VDEGVLEASVVVALVDVLEEGLDGGEDVAGDDAGDLVDFALVGPSEVLLVFVLARLYLVHSHLEQVAVGPKVGGHQIL